MREYNLGKIRGKASVLKKYISSPGVPPQEEFRKVAPPMPIAHPLLASCVDLQGRSVSPGSYPKENLDRELGGSNWVGIQQDELLTSQRPPRDSTLLTGAICQEIATSHSDAASERSNPFSPSCSLPFGSLLCVSQSTEKTMKKTRFFSSIEKSSK